MHDLKKKLQETEEKLEEYRQLNISLQKMLLEKNEEQHSKSFIVFFLIDTNIYF